MYIMQSKAIKHCYFTVFNWKVWKLRLIKYYKYISYCSFCIFLLFYYTWSHIQFFQIL